jgi:hypothetical protein
MEVPVKQSDVTSLKIKVDAALADAAPNSGIAFGLDAYNAFWKAGHISLQTFTALGTGAFPDILPAYGNNYAFCNCDLNADEIKVAGSSPMKS